MLIYKNGESKDQLAIPTGSNLGRNALSRKCFDFYLGLSCLFCFFIGILFTTGSGEYWLSLVDNYGAMGLTLIAFIEVIVVMYVYGHEKFTKDVEVKQLYHIIVSYVKIN